jgi:hypothetical protein
VTTVNSPRLLAALSEEQSLAVQQISACVLRWLQKWHVNHYKQEGSRDQHAYCIHLLLNTPILKMEVFRTGTVGAQKFESRTVKAMLCLFDTALLQAQEESCKVTAVLRCLDVMLIRSTRLMMGSLGERADDP